MLAGTIERYFANAKHSVSVHSDPQQAVTAADLQRPDIIITELQLAGRTGVEFLYEFCSYPDWQGLPVIIFSSLTSDQLAAYSEVFQELGVAAYVHKPAASLAQLLNKTEQILQPAHAEV